jgi:ABC-2 type transport system ATP-binding protein
VGVLGVDPATAGRDWRARIGVVLQDVRGRGDLTVAEVVRATARYYPHPRNATEVIDVVGLAEHAGKRVHALSGGQQRRLDVALGIVGRPELLFLDEPTTGFDPEARRAFWGLVRSLRDDGTTVLLTTHYLDEAAALADRAAVVSSGRVVALGTPDTLGGLRARTPVVRWRSGGEHHEERTTTPTALVTRLVAATGAGREIDGLTITRPSLEDVYLDLIHGQDAS